MVADAVITSETQAPYSGEQSLMPTVDENSPESVRTYIRWWIDCIKNTERFRSKRFERMARCSKFVRGEMWEGQLEDEDRYTVNIIQSEVQASVATLYAKDPTFVAKRKQRLDFKLWDENPKTFQEAQMAALELGDPAAMALIQDV